MTTDEIITSVRNPRIMELIRLRDRRGRSRERTILIDGRSEIRLALEAGVQIQDLFHCVSYLTPEDSAAILHPAQSLGARLTQVSQRVLAGICYGDRVEGLVAAALRPGSSLDNLRLGDCPLVAVVEGVEKPGNLGAILRTADCAGVDAVIVVGSGVDVFGPNVIRSSLGAVFCVPVAEASAEQVCQWLKDQRLPIVAADPSGRIAYTNADMRGPTAIVLGSEAAGLTACWRGPAIVSAAVPMVGRVDSLNVSVTAALFIYEALRQRGRHHEAGRGRPGRRR